MVLLLAALVVVWLCGSTLVLALCWAAGRGDEREALVRQELLRELAATRDDRTLALA